jgi:hypothetical protein
MGEYLDRVRLDARPDRVDFRDRPYQPPLASLPLQYPDSEHIKKFLSCYEPCILNQGNTDSCTGHGLAALINYIYWERWAIAGADETKRPVLVSPHMLYNNARLYDEWEGEDYGGSSCRGAMKGWYKHGSCACDHWKSEKERPQGHWRQDAARRPLGAYYRVDATSILDLQAAVREVHAVYCSAEVHEGWDRPGTPVEIAGIKLKMIQPGGKPAGGHAFALVGYTEDGFIIQNSWGPKWGTKGFALLAYEDWIANGYDAWVAAMGAPMRAATVSAAAQRAGLTDGLAFANAGQKQIAVAKRAGIPAWSEEDAYRHSIVMGNDGKIIRRLIDTPTAADNLDFVLGDMISQYKHETVVLYVHGGLNSEEQAIARARRMGPWFKNNGIHPLFVVWRTGILDALSQIAQDDVKRFEEQVKAIRARGLGDIVEAVVDRAREAFDRGFEAAAEKLIGKAVWSQMKQNAELAAKLEGAGIYELIARLSKHKGIKLHAAGHSAGSILLGHLLSAAKNKLAFSTCSLYAPACTLGFAAEHYGNAFKNGTLSKDGLHIDMLSDEAECRDTVGPYHKSLLYLVSRALEEKHKTPILGLDIAWKSNGKGSVMELDSDLHGVQFEAWSALAKTHGVTKERWKGPRVKVREGRQPLEINIAHGSFDNDLDVFNASLTRILGKEPKEWVTDLSGF